MWKIVPMWKIMHHKIRLLHWNLLIEISRNLIWGICVCGKCLNAKTPHAAEYLLTIALWLHGRLLLYDSPLVHHLLVLTHSAGLLVGESCLQWPPWMRCLCTNSSAEGSVQKWSAVFIFVYSKAHGPTEKTEAEKREHPLWWLAGFICCWLDLLVMDFAVLFPRPYNSASAA